MKGRNKMTNPETCRHNVIVAGISHELELHIHCVSCETDLTDPAMRVGKNYEYDSGHNVWVHTPKPKKFFEQKNEIDDIVREANNKE
jgi:hypothetical protein